MGLAVPVHEKETLISHPTIYTVPHKIADDDHKFPFYFLMMIPNTVGTIFKVFRHNDNGFPFLGLPIFVGLVLSQFCLAKYLSLPKNEKSSRKLLLKLTMWFLYTAISFGFVHQFSYFLSLQMTVALYAIVKVCSAFLFYAYIIHDYVKGWKIRSYSKDAIRLIQNRTLNHSDLVCANV